MTRFQWDPDLKETDAGFNERAVAEAIQVTLAPQSLRGDLPAELTLGMRLRREFALRNVTVLWSRGPEKRGPTSPHRGREILWHEDNRDRPIGRALVSTLTRSGTADDDVSESIARNFVAALRRRGLTAATAWNRIASFRGFTEAQMPEETRREYRDAVIEAFGDVLCVVLKNSNTSAIQVARMSGLSGSYVRDIMECRKDSVVSLDVLLRLRSALGCSAAYLVAFLEERLEPRCRGMKSDSIQLPSLTKYVVDLSGAESPTLPPSRDMASLAVATILRSTRLQLGGLSQEHFALEVGMDRTHVSQLERARTHPSIGTVVAVAHRLGVRASTFVALVEALIRTEIDDAHAHKLVEGAFRFEAISDGVLL